MYRLDRRNSTLWYVTVNFNETGYTIVRLAGLTGYQVQLFGVDCGQPYAELWQALQYARLTHTLEVIRNPA